METALAAGIAILGTLLGATLNHLFQKRQATHANDMATRVQLREERITAYSALANSVADLRGGQLLRWTARRENQVESDAYAQARSESWRLRTIARSSMYRVQLVTDDPAFALQARELVELTIEILDAVDADDLNSRAQQSSIATDAFIEEARRRLRVDLW